MQQLEPYSVNMGSGCLLKEPRFQGGNNAEAKLEADVLGIELQLESCILEL